MPPPPLASLRTHLGSPKLGILGIDGKGMGNGIGFGVGAGTGTGTGTGTGGSGKYSYVQPHLTPL